MSDLVTVKTMTVTIRDRGAEAPWGVGPTSPAIRAVTISHTCPTCGGPRGEAKPLNQHDDGASYTVDVWSNPCGHVDMYSAVVREAAGRAIRETATCECVVSCADDPATACSLSGEPHVHPLQDGIFGPCPVHPDAPGDL